ncbi:class II peroxidase [Xylona heveae TC161]|uniref:Peroxidase n=1 Tax=Xylona heveae (strain CBS 132557 / TC161) TaxID=1328760 RepID=A0A165IE83_XYLHT|nr:class II peroxidase [Xylona heveae TC161]KZF24770.1 class II peroxidase [Xylona heveae TC161]
MASAARTFSRSALRSGLSFRAAAKSNARAVLPRQAVRNSHRGFATEASPKSGGSGLAWGLGLVAAGGAGYYFYSKSTSAGEVAEKSKPQVFTPKKEDFQAVYDAIAKALEEHDDYDDGSYGPVLLRLAWHASGTYDKETGTGGSNGATMRFAPEGDHGANAGLKAARDFLEPIKAQFPWITHSDLWTLGGVCAIQEMQGPKIPWRPGRQDRDVSFCTPDGRLPDGSKEQSHLRAIFHRMGFDDREIVALSGAHALGRCHTDRSGYDGPWTFSPTVLTNEYYRLLLDEQWNWRKWNGPKQFQDKSSKSLMMLPTDMALVKDKAFKPHVERFAKDNDVFFGEFRDCVVKLFELGVPFTSSESDRFTFKASTDE